MLTASELDFLLRLRLVVARVGEMDLAKWWNTNGQLGSMGASVLHRGFPRSHRFAQARSVFAVASQRCHDLYDPPDVITLWSLPADIEDEFDKRWPTWIDEAADWEPFFVGLEECGADLEHELTARRLVTSDHVEQFGRTRRSAEQRAVALPGEFAASRNDLALLALGFARGEKGNPAVPFQSWNGGV